ncbi:MAG: erythromycin esterase family protein [Bacteroidetes bacterium]|jgi:erythromycin esterase|nr:erythromycin esterase family protein [Bacteroidota bacterium]MBT3749908.1 erythromycin esterase family protein [Bacteroidota bacterium]MBT4401163.1 erythromycin esterase family protein [Bacteroidota bacterium]MBT4411202.1 erythromycin esterase family protein [Bacteroidota bacterium]MBT7463733.1 erythromycin esterase family protein [Bacteroidota bacterium]
MKNKIKYIINLAIGIVMIIATFTSCINSQTESEKDPIFNWMKNNSYEIETLELSDQQQDLQQLEQIVGNAHVVCLGESRHDIREQFQLKHRFIKYLVEELGFTTFILEASLPYSELINGFIEKGEGNLDEIMANMPGWFLWDTQEMSDIISWMRAYNINPENENKLQFYGIDIVAPEYGLNSIFKYLKKVDAVDYKRFETLNLARELIVDRHWQTTFQRVAALPTVDKEVLRRNYSNLHKHILQNQFDFIAQSSQIEYDWILRLAYCAQEANRMFTAKTRMDMGLIRDSAMAENTLWIKRNNPKNDKTIIWAHNVHITKGEFKMTGESASIKGMGYILGQELKDDLVSIGASFNHGEFEEWDQSFPPAEKTMLDGTLAGLGMKFSLLDLKGETNDAEVLNWLKTDKVIRGQGFEMTFIPVNSFDAIFFINSISRTIPNQESLERFREMN